jgi:hypothetical protein
LLAIVRSATAELITPPERPGERLQREREAADALMQAGATPLIAARKLASDPRDPAEITRLAQRFRDHRRRAKKDADSASDADQTE